MLLTILKGISTESKINLSAWSVFSLNDLLIRKHQSILGLLLVSFQSSVHRARVTAAKVYERPKLSKES